LILLFDYAADLHEWWLPKRRIPWLQEWEKGWVRVYRTAMKYLLQYKELQEKYRKVLEKKQELHDLLSEALSKVREL